ncbi:hypothetical protein PTKIN_Ptkin16aG0544700 [Pterospermum kingtungense]
MEGIKVISMLLIVSAMLAPAVVAPQPRCEDKCDLKCSKMMPLLVTDTTICLRVCKMKCGLLHLKLLYRCTDSCAQLVPAALMSAKKTERYVNSCYKKCVKEIDN